MLEPTLQVYIRKPLLRCRELKLRRFEYLDSFFIRLVHLHLGRPFDHIFNSFFVGGIDQESKISSHRSVVIDQES
jgi:hypothetical protein